MTYQELIEYNKSRSICQIGILTHDVEKAARIWTERFKIGPWRFVTLSDESCHHTTIRRGDKIEELKNFKFKCALCSIANIQFELIEPVYGREDYDKFLEEHGEGIHHIKEQIPFDDWDKILDGYEKDGIRLANRGSYGNTSWAYLDTEELLGFAYELGDNLPNETFPQGSELHFYPPKED